MEIFKLEDHYKGNLPWLVPNTIFITLAGSRAYGTNSAESDWDYRGIVIEPKKYILGCFEKFEQTELKEPDVVIYGLRKFVKLASEMNPNIVELLFTDPSSWVKTTSLFEELYENRSLFLTTRCRYTFAGYATSQIKRIKTHKEYLLHPQEKEPKREDYGLNPFKSNITKDQQGALDELIEKGSINKEELSPNFLYILEREKAYFQARRQWEQYQTWKTNRNPVRAEIEAKFGYDCKHASQLVRLLRECEEILTTGEIYVRRPDAEELKAVRAGAWSYEKLMEWAETQEQKLEALYEKCDFLPKTPDYNKIDALCIDLVEKSFSLYR